MAKATRYDPIRIGDSSHHSAIDKPSPGSGHPVSSSRFDGSPRVAPQPSHLAYRLRARLISYWLTGGATAIAIYELVRR